MTLLNDVNISSDDVLVVIDIQNDFIKGGALEVPDGDAIIQGVNRIAQIFRKRGKRVVYTQDWHPIGHKSFASSHNGKNPFDAVEGIKGIGPILWPDHCIQGTLGAEFHPDLDLNLAHLIIRKGFRLEIDSYSAIRENDKSTETGLYGYLRNINARRIFISGLALDYCVNYTAQDSAKKGFEVVVIHDLTRGIMKETVDQTIRELTELGVKFVESSKIL